MSNKNEEFNRQQHAAARPRAMRIIELRMRGRTWKQIGELLGVSSQRVQQIAKAHQGRWAKPGRPRKVSA